MQLAVDGPIFHLAFVAHLCGYWNTQCMHNHPTSCPPFLGQPIDSFLSYSHLATHSPTPLSFVARFRNHFSLFAYSGMNTLHCKHALTSALAFLSSFGFLALAISYGDIKIHQHTHPLPHHYHSPPHHYHPQCILHQKPILAQHTTQYGYL